MNELNTLQNQCDEIEKIVQDLKVETVGLCNDSLEALVNGLEDGVIEMSKIVDEVRNKIMGE